MALLPKKVRNHTNLKNDGSRFGIRVKHDLAEDLFAFGRLELRFNSGAKTADQFGDLYAHRAYVGFGSKQYGEVSFGRQVTIGDDIAQAGFDNTYGVTKTPLTTEGKSVVRYDYKGIEGLQIGVDYRFAEERYDDSLTAGGPEGEVKTEYEKANGDVVNPIKNGYGFGALYGFQVAEGQSAKVAAGYTRDNYKTTGNYRHYRDAVMVGGKYTINNLTLALDYGFSNEKKGSSRAIFNGLQTGAKYQVTPAVAVYGNYVYLNGKTKENGQVTGKDKSHRFMLGTEYQVHKNVFTFVEGRIQKTNEYDGQGNKVESVRDNAIGVGLRVFW